MKVRNQLSNVSKQQIPKINLSTSKIVRTKLRPLSVGKIISQKEDIEIKLKKNQQSVRRGTLKNPLGPTNQKMQKGQFFNKYLSDPCVINHLSLMSLIGKGCFSVVQLAVDKKSQKAFAIKTYQKIDQLDWHRLDNIRRQIQNLQSLHHQNVIELLHVIQDRKKILLVMENGGKQSLAGLLRKNKKFKQQQVKKYFKQILTAISYCHQNGVCHRDLKLENILIDNDGKIKIIDFGFSANSKIKLNTFCGTPPYMCPEIVKKIPYSGASADVWALGVIFYLMLFGTYPFKASQSSKESIKLNLKTSPLSLLNNFLAKCCKQMFHKGLLHISYWNKTGQNE